MSAAAARVVDPAVVRRRQLAKARPRRHRAGVRRVACNITLANSGLTIVAFDLADADFESFAVELGLLPLSYNEREDLKHGGVPHILAWFARSLEARYYDYLEHPPFDDYACGVMASEHAPDFIKKEQLLKRFPPRPLDGLGPGLYWEPPEEHARTMAAYRRSEARAASYRASRDDPSKPATRSQ